MHLAELYTLNRLKICVFKKLTVISSLAAIFCGSLCLTFFLMNPFILCFQVPFSRYTRTPGLP